MITAEQLRLLLDYDEKTGLFHWRGSLVFHKRRGHAGWLEPRGYWRICINGKNYQAHRLAWLWVTGEWPAFQIDHANLNKADNRWSNLRQATNSQNHANVGKRRHNTSGIKGVYWHKRRCKWQAAIMVNGSLRALGYCNTKEEAAELYAVAAREHFGEFARTA